MTPYFVVTPEDAGRAGASPREGRALYLFDTWLGDELVQAYPRFLVTAALARTLAEALPEPTGFQASPTTVKASPFLRRHRPELRLPRFWVVDVQGRAGVHPFGLTEDHSLVVSQPALECLVRHSIPHLQFSQFVPRTEARPAEILGKLAPGRVGPR